MHCTRSPEALSCLSVSRPDPNLCPSSLRTIPGASFFRTRPVHFCRARVARARHTPALSRAGPEAALSRHLDASSAFGLAVPGGAWSSVLTISRRSSAKPENRQGCDEGPSESPAPKLHRDTMTKRRIRRSLQCDERPDVLGPSSDRDERGRFKKNNTCSRGNRSRTGQRGLRRLIHDAVTDRDLRAIVATAVAEARRGDHRARSWLFDRIGGTARAEFNDERAQIDVGAIESVAACGEAQRTIVRAAASGKIALAHAAALSQLVEQTSHRLAETELTARLEALEHLVAGAR